MGLRKEHVRVSSWLRLYLIALALLNLWISYTIRAEHPVQATVNAAMAAVLLVVLAVS